MALIHSFCVSYCTDTLLLYLQWHWYTPDMSHVALIHSWCVSCCTDALLQGLLLHWYNPTVSHTVLMYFYCISYSTDTLLRYLLWQWYTTAVSHIYKRLLLFCHTFCLLKVKVFFLQFCDVCNALFNQKYPIHAVPGSTGGEKQTKRYTNRHTDIVTFKMNLPRSQLPQKGEQ